MSKPPIFRKSNLLWIFAYPIYQVIGTIRHEASHALTAVLQGGRITEFVFLPSVREGLGFSWGYVRWIGETNWTVRAAPYFVDLLTFLFLFTICMQVLFNRRWIWLNLVIIGMVSPVVNSAYNYLGGLKSNNDVGRLLAILPSWMVHTSFIAALVFYVVGIVLAFRYSRSVLKWKSTA